MHCAIRSLSRAFAALLALSLLGPPAAAQHPRPTGAWRLDQAHADSVMSRLLRPEHPPGAPARQEPPGPGSEGPGAAGPQVTGGAGSVPGGEGRPPGHYGRTPSDKDLARMRQTMDLVRAAPRRIAFSAGDSIVSLTDSSGEVTAWRTDGKKVTTKLGDGDAVETRVRWGGDALIIERRVKGGGRVTERYLLGLGDRRLIAAVEADGLMQPMAFTRRYEPED